MKNQRLKQIPLPMFIISDALIPVGGTPTGKKNRMKYSLYNFSDRKPTNLN